MNNDTMFYGFFRSPDNGASLQLINYSTDPNEPGQIDFGSIVSDASDNIIYNYRNSDLWISHNGGVSWNQCNNYLKPTPIYISGSETGEIYFHEDTVLQRSTDFGYTFFETMNPCWLEICDVGIAPGEVYGLSGHWTDTMSVSYSNDYGQSFINYDMDSITMINQPVLSRGAIPGEVYLLIKYNLDYYKVLYSSDNGQSFDLKYESDYYNSFNWSIQFLAGNQSGELYVVKARISPNWTHTWLFIDYSIDYGKTYTTFFHDLDSSITVSIAENERYSVFSEEIQASPNPVSERSTISFSLKQNTEILYTLLNSIGEVVIPEEKKYFRKGKNSFDLNLSGVKPGIYYYRLYSSSRNIEVCKLIKK